MFGFGKRSNEGDQMLEVIILHNGAEERYVLLQQLLFLFLMGRWSSDDNLDLQTVNIVLLSVIIQTPSLSRKIASQEHVDAYNYSQKHCIKFAW